MNGRELLAWNLRKLRTERGLSQEKLATDAGVDRAYLGGIERLAENPSVDRIEQIAGALGVPLAALFRVPAQGEQPARPLPPGRRRGKSV